MLEFHSIPITGVARPITGVARPIGGVARALSIFAWARVVVRAFVDGERLPIVPICMMTIDAMAPHVTPHFVAGDGSLADGTLCGLGAVAKATYAEGRRSKSPSF